MLGETVGRGCDDNGDKDDDGDGDAVDVFFPVVLFLAVCDEVFFVFDDAVAEEGFGDVCDDDDDDDDDDACCVVCCAALSLLYRGLHSTVALWRNKNQ